MLKKVIYLGLGLASIVIEKVSELARVGEDTLFEEEDVTVRKPPAKQPAPQEPVVAAVPPKPTKAAPPPQPVPTATTAVAAAAVAEPPTKVDDLTQIKGIGPTFAKRLKEAGISSYIALAAATPARLKEVTNVADWQADPEEWIAQAKALT